MLSICRPSKLGGWHLHMFSGLAPVTAKAADGFLSPPAVLQAAALDCGGAGNPLAGVPAGASLAHVPTSAVKSNIVLHSGNGDALLPAADGSSVHGASLLGVRFCAAHQLEPTLADARQMLDASQTLYSLEWQASHSLTTQALVHLSDRPTPALATALPARRRTGLCLSQAASTAAAGAVQMLHAHQAVGLTTVALHSVDGVPARLQPIPVRAAVGAAAIAGLLKSLPFEMSCTSEQLDIGATACGQKHSFTLAAAALPTSMQADLYGVAARGSTLHRPLMTYKSAGSSDSGISAAPSWGPHAITGGTGGIGLLTAGWLAGCGVPAVILLSRSGMAASAADGAAAMRASATSLVLIAKCDVSSSEDAHLLARIARAQHDAFAGIVHAAGLQVCSSLP